MDVGIGMGPRNLPSRPSPLTEVYRDYVDDIVRAEELGFDAAWIGEHRMTPDQWTPSPMTLLAHAAARTSTIRLGTSVLCLPFHDPLRVAEDVAAIDILSRGRFNFGFGAGSQFEEFRTFGIESRTRMSRTYESAAFIRKALGTDEEFSWEGRYYSFPHVRFTTRPVQDEIPFFAAAIGPKSVELAAAAGYNLMSRGTAGWVEGLSAAGHDISGLKAEEIYPVVVAPTTAEAWEAGGEGVLYHLNFYALRRRLDGSLPDPADVTITRQDVIDKGLAAIGSPDEVLEQITRVKGSLHESTTGLDFQVRSPGMRTEDVTRSMELIARELMPALREL